MAGQTTWPIRFRSKIETAVFASSLAAIDALVASLRNLPLPPAAVSRIEQLNIIRAIHGTTGLEGNTMNEEQVADIIAGGVTDALTDEGRENYNAGRVMEFIKADKPGSTLKISQEYIKHVHAMTTEGIRNAWNEPGRYRREVVYAGAYPFPGPADIPHLMRDFVTFINSSECMAPHPVVRAAIAHFYLVSIHPFGDGNGRVARAIEAYLIYHSGYQAAGFYSLANFYYRNRAEYIRQLEDARFKYNGDLTEFLAFACRGFVEELSDLNKIAVPYLKIIKYTHAVDEAVTTGRISQRVGVVLKTIAASGNGISTRELIARLPDWARTAYRGKTDWTVRNDLTIMRQSGLIEETDGRIYPNLNAIDSPPK